MSETIDFEKDLEKLLDQEPFVPFEIVLSSGDRCEVLNPRLVAMGRNVVVVLYPQGGHEFFRMSQMVGVKIRESAQPR